MNNPAQMPSYFRKLVREQMAAPALERLRQTAMGELVFKRPMIVNEVVEFVECEASEVTQRPALVDLLNIALLRQAAFVDDEGNNQMGVVILSPLNDDRSEMTGGRYEVVEEDLDKAFEPRREDRDAGPQRLDETISPAIVAQILVKRRNGNRSD